MADSSPKKPRNKSGNSLFIGMMAGLAGGVLLAAGVALYVSHLSTPIPPHSTALPVSAEKPSGIDLTKRGMLNPQPITAGSAPDNSSTNPPVSLPTSAPSTQLPLAGPLESSDSLTPPSSSVANTVPSPLSDELHPVTVRYFVQTGAFGQTSEAEAQRANLALLGIDSTVLPTQTDGKALYFRVRIGPFSSVDEVRTLVKTLKDNAIPTQVLRETITSHSSLIPR
ncbi:MAG: hypothetical protein G3H99_01215 [Ferrovum sp.]|nr:hypothetical protein [Ferrovum sp.]NDU87978.1 hypothetical protein [Ferrovum sp.]